jgi:U6 snRNA-associated Sm-like protein LSm8
MSAALLEWKDNEVCVMTCDGRLIQGTLAGYDQLQNLIIKNAQERVYQMPKDRDDDDQTDADAEILEMIPLGLYVIRGDNVAVVSDVREGILEEQAKNQYEGFENGEGIKGVVQAGF